MIGVFDAAIEALRGALDLCRGGLLGQRCIFKPDDLPKDRCAFFGLILNCLYIQRVEI